MMGSPAVVGVGRGFSISYFSSVDWPGTTALERRYVRIARHRE